MTTSVCLSILIGVCLSAMAGFRLFIPLLAMSLAVRFGAVSVSPDFQWVGGDIALYALGVAAVCETLAYLVPYFDHLLDMAGVWLVPIAGMCLTYAVLPETDAGFVKFASAALVGGGLPLGVHLGNATTRAASTATTGGLANPLLSLCQTAWAIVGSIVAVLAPILCAILLFCVGAAFVTVFLWVRRRRLRAARANAVDRDAPLLP